jgi:hypothetical protein
MDALTSDDLHDLPPDHPARLLMIAHRRLSSRPAASNGMKSTVVVAYGDYVVRLVAFGPPITNAVSALWVELHDAFNDRGLDGAGCNELSDAIAAAEEFLARARILNARSVAT